MLTHSKILPVLMACLLSITTVWASPKTFVLQKADKTIYLFGTLHQTKAGFLPLPPAVTAQLSAADALAVEMDTETDEVEQAIAVLMITYGHLPRPQKLIDVIGEKSMQRLTRLPLSSEQLTSMQGLRPWLVSLMIPLVLAEEMGYTEKSVDDYLIQWARKNQQPVIALETPEEQINIFATLTEKEELALFEQTLDEAEDIKNHMQSIDDIWLNNNATAARALLTDMQQGMPKIYQALIVTRNHNIVERSIKLNQKHPTLFVAVGAAHLYENDGLVKLLQQKGYQLVTP